MSQFNAYVKIEENRYREVFGLSFEEFEVGQKFKHRPGLTISQQDNKDEALDTINNAQLHYDGHYASKTEWKSCLGVSTLTLQKVIGMTWKTFGKKQRIIGYDDIAMTHPVFGGDTLYAESEIVAKEECYRDPEVGILTVLTCALNQKDEVVSKISYRMLVYKQGNHPLEKDAGENFMIAEGDKFASHHQTEDGVYMEEVGIYFEDLTIGEVYEHRPAKTFTAEENRMHALRSLEWSPQYANFHYAEKFHSGRVPINETFLVGAVTALTTRTFDRVVANLQWKNIKLPHPTYAGDTVYAESKILFKRESKSRPEQGIMQADTYAYNQHGELVCSYERHFLIYKKGLGPYKAAGY
ncbi:MAG: dehydratase [Bacteroidetes bacterium]|nr:dehydratase [Bacteroidota bacterium]